MSRTPAHPCSSVPARLPFTIFQGGMPRASYGDRHCISVIHNGQQTAFDFTSRVIDFAVLTEADPAAGRRASRCRSLATGRYGDAGPSVNEEEGPAWAFPNLPLSESPLHPFFMPLRPTATVRPFLPLSASLWLHPCWPHLLPTPRSLWPPLAQMGLGPKWADLYCWMWHPPALGKGVLARMW